MPNILLATKNDAVASELGAALDVTQIIHRVRSGDAVIPAIKQIRPDLVILDFQIGNMGGVAACLEVRYAEQSGLLNPSVIYLLLDREVDTFLANRAGADRVLTKPISSYKTLRTVEQALAVV